MINRLQRKVDFNKQEEVRKQIIEEIKARAPKKSTESLENILFNSGDRNAKLFS